MKPGCCAKVGGINPPEGMWETPWFKSLFESDTHTDTNRHADIMFSHVGL